MSSAVAERTPARYGTLCVLAAALWLAGGVAWADGTALQREWHPWGRFDEGAWKRYRTQTDTFGENGAVAESSSSETRVTLEKIEAQGVVLRMESTLEIGGKQLEPEPRSVAQGFHGEPAGDNLVVSEQGEEDVAVDGGRRNIKCRIELLEKNDPQGKTSTRIFYSDRVHPYVLKRETVRTDASGTKQLDRTVMTVQSLNAPCRVLTIRRAAHLVAETKHAKGTTKTFAFVSQHVPGGVICQTTEEYDENGRLLRRATLQLLDYGLEPEKDRPPLAERWRKRPARGTRAPATPIERRQKDLK